MHQTPDLLHECTTCLFLPRGQTRIHIATLQIHSKNLNLEIENTRGYDARRVFG